MKQSTFKAGQKWKVIAEGCSLAGMKPIGAGAQQGWGMKLPRGTVLTCHGVHMTFGDGVPVVKWLDENGKWIANDCELQPSTGGMWHSTPKPGTITPWSPEAEAWSTVDGAIDHRTLFEASLREAWDHPNDAKDVEALLARVEPLKGDWVVWDPQNDPDKFLAVGDDPFALLKEAAKFHELEV